MKLEQSFTVTAPVEQVWATLVDVERVAPCLPGAEISGQSPDGGYEGTFTVKLGPATAAYRGTLRMESLDEASRTATMSAKGTDKRGQGGASASIVSTMRQEGDETHVDVVTDFTITGRLARFGRGGMIEDISKRLMRDFANCLQASLGAEPAPAAAAESAPMPPSSEREQAQAGLASTAAAQGPGGPSAGAEPPADEQRAAPATPLGGEEPLAAEQAGRGEPSEPAEPAAPLPEEPAAAPPSAPEPAAPLAEEPAAPATPLGGEEALAAEQAAREAPLPGEEAAAAEPPAAEPAPSEPAEPPAPEPAGAGPQRSAGDVDPWGPLSPPAEPPPPEEPPAPRTESIPPPTAQGAAPPPAKPVKGLSLLFGVLWDRVKRFFARLFGRGR
jgi:carbon monoxide dehydrogenase subunit G